MPSPLGVECLLGRGEVVWSSLASAVHQSVGSPTDWLVLMDSLLIGWVWWLAVQSAPHPSSVVLG